MNTISIIIQRVAYETAMRIIMEKYMNGDLVKLFHKTKTNIRSRCILVQNESDSTLCADFLKYMTIALANKYSRISNIDLDTTYINDTVCMKVDHQLYKIIDQILDMYVISDDLKEL